MDYLSNCIADFYVKRKIIQADEKNVYQCGVALILNDIVTFALILLLSACFWYVRYGIEFLIVFCFTRVFCGGYHAPKTYICRMTMLITFFCVVILSSLLKNSPALVLYLIVSVSFLMILPLIPVKHPNKELTKELIKKNRRKGIITYILFAIVAILVSAFLKKQDGMMIALSLSAVTALAIIGTLTNERRDKHEKGNK